MLTYIDGYNLLFRISERNIDFQEQRDSIITDLNTIGELINEHFIIVFDATYQADPASYFQYHSATVVFTRAGQCADEYLMDSVKNALDPHNYLIVTSDKRLARRVGYFGGRTISVEQFTKNLRRRYNKKQQPRPQKRELPSIKKPAAKDPAPENAHYSDLIDYYIKVFEERLKSLSPEKKERKSMRKKKDPLSFDNDEPNVKSLSWQEIFEKRLKNLEND